MSNTTEFIIENGVLVKYVGPGGDVVIPDGVTEIGARSFEGRGYSIRSVTIPEGVETIGDAAFTCSSIKKLSIPKTVMKIGTGAFAVNEIQEFPNLEGVSEIGESVFSSSRFQSVRIPGNIKRILRDAFHNCIHLKELVIEEGTEMIGFCAFFDCHQLENVYLPESVTVIEEHAFDSCCNLKNFFAPGVNFSSLSGSALKKVACKYFLSHMDEYTQEDVAASYRRYLLSQKKKWLPVIFSEDRVDALRVFSNAGKITAKNIIEEFIKPATEANAVKCIAFLNQLDV